MGNFNLPHFVNLTLSCVAVTQQTPLQKEWGPLVEALPGSFFTSVAQLMVQYTILFTIVRLKIRDSEVCSEFQPKHDQAVKILPTSIKDKMVPRTKAPCILFTKRSKKKEANGDQEGY
eukprot:1153814-Pelagomonas_calceolata.AAC.2